MFDVDDSRTSKAEAIFIAVLTISDSVAANSLPNLTNTDAKLPKFLSGNLVIAASLDKANDASSADIVVATVN